MGKTLKITLLCLFALSFPPREINAAEDLGRFLNQLEYANVGDPDFVSSRRLIEEMVLTDNDSADAVLAATFDPKKSAAFKCELISILGKSQNREISKKLSAHLDSSDDMIKVCAAKALGNQNNDALIASLIETIERYQYGAVSKGPYEKDLKAELAAINAIGLLGEIGDPNTIEKLWPFYVFGDEVIKINVLISIGKIKGSKAISILKDVVDSPKESDVIKSVAWELIDYANGVKD